MMAAPDGVTALSVRTLSGVRIRVPAVAADATVQLLRQSVTLHFGAGSNCRLFLNVS